MYDLKRTQADKVLEKNVAAGVVINDEGACLVRTLESGLEVMNLSSGLTGESFAGFATMDNANITTEVGVETKTVPASGTLLVTLDRDNLSTATNDLRVVCNSLDTAASTLTIVTTGAPANDQVLVDYTNGTLTFHAGEAGLPTTVYYRRNLTVVESKQKYHERHINNSASSTFAQVGVKTSHGQIFFDQYVINKDYSATAVGAVRTGLGGRVTVAATGTGGAGARVGAVIKTPTVLDPLLGIAFSTETD